MTLVYEDGSRPDQTFDLIPTNAESPDDNTNMFVGTDTADAIESAQSVSIFGAGEDNTVTIESGTSGRLPADCLGRRTMSGFLAAASGKIDESIGHLCIIVDNAENINSHLWLFLWWQQMDYNKASGPGNSEIGAFILTIFN